jgi:Leucine-rich repeat (LRR) protein
VELPKTLGTLHNLKELYLAHNQLESLPKNFTQLNNLEHLDLCGNLLPKSWGCFFSGKKRIGRFFDILTAL